MVKTGIIIGHKEIKYLLVTMFCLVVADGVLSNYLISNGYGSEWNPFLVSIVGTDSLLLLKVVAAIVSMFLLWDIYNRRPTMGAVSITLIVIVYTGIVYWNINTFLLAAIYQ